MGGYRHVIPELHAMAVCGHGRRQVGVGAAGGPGHNRVTGWTARARRFRPVTTGPRRRL